ncbi:MAG TPA: gluconokinase, GntK/IdnK-type, partial [Mycobacterium sp.]|nr:gluconokinase, GntK/IdnK-type [Mycobacterium sp.]
ENVEKMASGQPLTDDDRWPWLDAVASWIREHDFAGIPGIVTCSALKRAYRDRLRGPRVVFVYLAGDHGEIRNRLSARINHYMPPALLESQLAWLEPPAADERAVTIGSAARPAEISAEIIRRLGLRPEPFSSALGARAPGYSSAPPLGD